MQINANFDVLPDLQCKFYMCIDICCCLFFEHSEVCLVLCLFALGWRAGMCVQCACVWNRQNTTIHVTNTTGTNAEKRRKMLSLIIIWVGVVENVNHTINDNNNNDTDDDDSNRSPLPQTPPRVARTNFA